MSKPWSGQEIHSILYDGKDDITLAVELHRTVRAIRDKRRKVQAINAKVIPPELEQEWVRFCKDEYQEWSKTNPPSPLFINNPRWMYEWEVERTKNWIGHINPIVERWWKVHGYKITWPANDRDPISIEKAEA
jgi:hypothetical protein